MMVSTIELHNHCKWQDLHIGIRHCPLSGGNQEPLLNDSEDSAYWLDINATLRQDVREK
jgi:hypothetical protein